ncbi:kinase-like domain-containing protein [Aspergillus heterothallicus]
MERVFTPFTDPASRAADSKFPLDGVEIQHLSNDSFAALLFSAPSLYDLGQTTVARLSKGLAMKKGGNVLPSEAAILKLIADSGIRAPRVHRSWQVEDETKYFGTMGYIVMDYIDGRPLDSCWDSLTGEKKLDVAEQTAEMIRKLQSIKLPTAWPVGGGPCRGQFFTQYTAGPFENTSQMEDWFNHKLDICKAWKHASQDLPAFKFTDFVLTHQDISPRNLILDTEGHVWLVDWADAGAYPRAFEGAAISCQSAFPGFNEMVLSLIPRYPGEEEQLKSIGYALSTAPFA